MGQFLWVMLYLIGIGKSQQSRLQVANWIQFGSFHQGARHWMMENGFLNDVKGDDRSRVLLPCGTAPQRPRLPEAWCWPHWVHCNPSLQDRNWRLDWHLHGKQEERHKPADGWRHLSFDSLFFRSLRKSDIDWVSDTISVSMCLSVCLYHLNVV